MERSFGDSFEEKAWQVFQNGPFKGLIMTLIDWYKNVRYFLSVWIDESFLKFSTQIINAEFKKNTEVMDLIP